MAEEQKLITGAFNDFVNKNFASCLSTLNSLLASRVNDPKILHNRAVVELFNSNHKNIDVFQRTLTSLCNLMNINTLESEVPDDLHHCVMYYNQAIVYFYQKDYDLALGIITKVFSLIKPMDEVLAFKVCLLLLELNLYCVQIEKALSHLSYIENQFFPSGFGNNIIKCNKGNNLQTTVISLDEFKAKLLNYKSRCLLAEKSYDECRDVLDLIYSSGAQNYSTILTKAQLNYVQHHYQDALNSIIVIQEDVDNFVILGDARTLVFCNNIACIYHCLGKPSLCCFFMCKAFNQFRTAIENHKKPARRLTGPRDLFQPSMLPKIMYNRGVALLFAYKPSEAFDCFTEAVQSMHKSSLVWLRLAECCIMLYKKGNEDLFNFMSKRKELVANMVGNGNLKRTILNSSIFKDTAYNSEPQSYAVPVPTIEFATICIGNSYALLKAGEGKLRHAVLAAMSYIHLTIGDPVKAHKYSMILFEDKSASVIYKYLARLYVAESLIMLNRLQEAADMLNPASYKDYDLSQEASKCSWTPRTQVTGEAILKYNLAVVLAIRGELKKASEILKSVWICKGQKAEIPIHVIALALYIELVLGHNDIARTIIKQNCPMAFSMK